MGKVIELFKAGKYPQGNYTEKDLDEIVQTYSPALHEAPMVVGHPKKAAPAWGWVERVFRRGGLLLGEVKQVQPEFAEWVKRGLYKKRSITLDRSIVPGKLYLKNVGWLGAFSPQVKGLADVEFGSSSEDVVVEFADEAAPGLTGLAGIPQEELLARAERPGTEGGPIDLAAHLAVAGQTFTRAELMRVAAKALADAGFRTSEEMLAEIVGNQNDVFKEDKDMSEGTNNQAAPADPAAPAAQTAPPPAPEQAEFAEKVKTVEAENARLKRQLRLAEIKTRLEALQAAGKVTPGMRKGLAEFMADLEGETVVEFAEGVKETTEGFMWKFLESIPKVVEFGEPGLADKAADSEPLPAEYEGADPGKANLYRKAKAYAKEHQCDFRTALDAVK